MNHVNKNLLNIFLLFFISPPCPVLNSFLGSRSFVYLLTNIFFDIFALRIKADHNYLRVIFPPAPLGGNSTRQRKGGIPPKPCRCRRAFPLGQSPIKNYSISFIVDKSLIRSAISGSPVCRLNTYFLTGGCNNNKLRNWVEGNLRPRPQ